VSEKSIPWAVEQAPAEAGIMTVRSTAPGNLDDDPLRSETDLLGLRDGVPDGSDSTGKSRSHDKRSVTRPLTHLDSWLEGPPHADARVIDLCPRRSRLVRGFDLRRALVERRAAPTPETSSGHIRLVDRRWLPSTS
jgi:hypothetical protein